MSEYVWTVITVGGAVKRSDLAKLKSVVEACAAENDSGYGSDYLPIGGEALHFEGEFNLGTLPEGCERVLQELGLFYRVWHGAGRGWQEGIHQWSPDNGWQGCAAIDGEPCRTFTELEKARDAGAPVGDVVWELLPFKQDIPPITIVEDVATDCQAAEVQLADMNREQLAAEYVRCIGYDPFADDPSRTESEVRTTLQEWRDAVAESRSAETAGPENGFMDAAAALQIVLDLARQNMADQHDMPHEYARQLVALNTVEDMAVNQLGDE